MVEAKLAGLEGFYARSVVGKDPLVGKLGGVDRHESVIEVVVVGIQPIGHFCIFGKTDRLIIVSNNDDDVLHFAIGDAADREKLVIGKNATQCLYERAGHAGVVGIEAPNVIKKSDPAWSEPGPQAREEFSSEQVWGSIVATVHDIRKNHVVCRRSTGEEYPGVLCEVA